MSYFKAKMHQIRF